MSRGLSKRQRQALATLVVAKRALDVTRELGPLVGMPATESGRRSLLRAVRSLAQRGLVTITRAPRQGWPAVMVEATPGATGELRAPDWQRAATAVDKSERRLEKAKARVKVKRPAFRGKAHPPMPTGAGLATVIDNLSRYPDSEVIPLVELAIEQVDMRGVHIKIKNRRRRGVSGRAYPAVPGIATVAPGMLYLVTILVGSAESFPVREHRYGFTEPGPRNQFPIISYADWREGLVAVAAHEAMHVQQFKQGDPRSELQTSHFEAETLDRYRANRPKGNG
jgi:hypothetical protein